MLRIRNKSQSTLEYAVIIAVLAGALLAINIYMKRGVQGKLRESVDEIGQQYSAGNTPSKYTITQKNDDAATRETFGIAQGGSITDENSFAKGVSYYEVKTPATITREATGDNAEQITTKLNDESLFPGESSTPGGTGGGCPGGSASACLQICLADNPNAQSCPQCIGCPVK